MVFLVSCLREMILLLDKCCQDERDGIVVCLELVSVCIISWRVPVFSLW